MTIWFLFGEWHQSYSTTFHGIVAFWFLSIECLCILFYNLGMKAFDLIIPKNKVEYLYSDITVGDALRKIGKKKFAMVPVIERVSERYLYSLSAGDILYEILKKDDIKACKNEMLAEVTIDRLIVPCHKDTELADLADLAIAQNFVPIVDGNGTFLGIVTRRSILDYFISNSPELEGE